MAEPGRHWKKIKSTLASAFSVDDESEWSPNERQKEIIEKLARWVVNHRLTLPAVMTLESITPLNYLGSQAMVFFHPFVSAFLNTKDYTEFQQMLEYRQSIHFMVQVLEQREDAFIAEQKAQRASRRKGASSSNGPESSGMEQEYKE